MSRNLFVLLVLSLGISACGRSAGTADGPSSPVLGPGAEALAALNESGRDCLQYSVEHRPDGTEVWHADYVYFYLVRESDGKPVVDGHGAPVASGLLRGEVLAWMEGREPMPGTGWTYQVMRTVQELNGGQVIRESEPVLVQDADLAELLAKDRAARRS